MAAKSNKKAIETNVDTIENTIDIAAESTLPSAQEETITELSDVQKLVAIEVKQLEEHNEELKAKIKENKKRISELTRKQTVDGAPSKKQQCLDWLALNGNSVNLNGFVSWGMQFTEASPIYLTTIHKQWMKSKAE